MKLRGLRIELGEIETVLTEQPTCRTRRVLVRNDGPAEQLVAYVVGDVDVECADGRAAVSDSRRTWFRRR